MNKFPTINHLNDLVPFIQSNPQFRIAEQDNGTTVICYMLQDEDTFRGENEEYAKECRGITFDTVTGVVLSRTLHKFENVGQSDASQPENIPWGKIIRVMDKRDGSMITPVLINGEVVCKTKKTFTSNEAIAATEFLRKDPEKLHWVKTMLLGGYTPTFEWTSPRFPIVLTYDKDELTLLQMRENDTGDYLVYALMNFTCPFPIVENVKDQFSSGGLVMWQYFEHAAANTTGVEGWIIQTEDGEMWKVKTKWYCDLHHSVTFTRWRDVARTVCEDKSDDLKAAFAMTGRSIEPILQVERQIKKIIEHKQAWIKAIVDTGHNDGYTPKEMALEFKDDELFGQIMRVFRGQEINWLEWFRKNHIKSFPLDVIPTAVVNEDIEQKADEA